MRNTNDMTSTMIDQLNEYNTNPGDTIIRILANMDAPISGEGAVKVMLYASRRDCDDVKKNAIQALQNCETDVSTSAIKAVLYSSRSNKLTNICASAFLEYNNKHLIRSSFELFESGGFDFKDLDTIIQLSRINIERTCQELKKKGPDRQTTAIKSKALAAVAWVNGYALKYHLTNNCDDLERAMFHANLMMLSDDAPSEETSLWAFEKAKQKLEIEPKDRTAISIIARLAMTNVVALEYMEAEKDKLNTAFDLFEDWVIPQTRKWTTQKETKSIYESLVKRPLCLGWGKRINFCAKVRWSSALLIAIEHARGSSLNYVYRKLDEVWSQ